MEARGNHHEQEFHVVLAVYPFIFLNLLLLSDSLSKRAPIL